MIIFSKKLVAYFSVVDQVDDFLSISTSDSGIQGPDAHASKTGEGDSVRGKPFLIRSVKPQTGASRSSGVEKGAHDGGGETRTHQFAQIFACFEIPRGGTF